MYVLLKLHTYYKYTMNTNTGEIGGLRCNALHLTNGLPGVMCEMSSKNLATRSRSCVTWILPIVILISHILIVLASWLVFSIENSEEFLLLSLLSPTLWPYHPIPTRVYIRDFCVLGQKTLPSPSLVVIGFVAQLESNCWTNTIMAIVSVERVTTIFLLCISRKSYHDIITFYFWYAGNLVTPNVHARPNLRSSFFIIHKIAVVDPFITIVIFSKSRRVPEDVLSSMKFPPAVIGSEIFPFVIVRVFSNELGIFFWTCGNRNFIHLGRMRSVQKIGLRCSVSEIPWL